MRPIPKIEKTDASAGKGSANRDGAVSLIRYPWFGQRLVLSITPERTPAAWVRAVSNRTRASGTVVTLDVARVRGRVKIRRPNQQSRQGYSPFVVPVSGANGPRLTRPPRIYACWSNGSLLQHALGEIMTSLVRTTHSIITRGAFALLLLIAVLSTGANAHDLKVWPAGTPVFHLHLGLCTANGCPASDADWEQSKRVASGDRVYSGTYEWNCHGRTFDARHSWINNMDISPYFTNGATFAPPTPLPGDAVIWWNNDSEIVHTATVTSLPSFFWQEPTIMSKYGKQGQYRHGLSNATRIYQPNWAYVRFPATIPVFPTRAANDQSVLLDAKHPPSTSMRGVIEALRAQSEQAPWYEAVLMSKVVYAVEHPREVTRLSGLSTKTQQRLTATRNVTDQVAILFDDLRDQNHYVHLGAYEQPSHSTAYIRGLEAGELLVKVATEIQPALRDTIVSGFKAMINEVWDAVDDERHGAGIYFLGRVLAAEERDELRQEWPGGLSTSSVATATQSYVSYYLSQW